MKNDIQQTKTQFQEWLMQRENQLPISALFWQIEPIGKSEGKTIYTPKIKLKKHDAEVFRITPFYKPYSKIFVL